MKKKYKSIFVQFVVPVILMVVLLVAVIIAGVYATFTDSYEKQVKAQNLETSELIAKQVETFMGLAYHLTEGLSVNSDIVSMKTKKQTPVLVDSADKNDFVELYYIQGMDGMQTARSTGELADRSTRWWFQQMLEEKQPFISKSYYSVNTDMPCTSVFFPIEKDGEMEGIFATDIKLSSLQELIEKSSGSREGRYSFIIDGEGVVAAHPENVYLEELYNYKNLTKTVSVKDDRGNVMYDPDGNVQTEEQPIEVSDGFKKMIDTVMAGSAGSGEVKENGEMLYVGYAPVQLDGNSDSWSVLTVQTESSAMAVRDRIMRLCAAAGFFVLLAGFFLIFLMTRRILIPIHRMREMADNMAQGNFDMTSGYQSSSEIGAIAESLDRTSESIRGIVKDITAQLEGIACGDFTKTSEREYSGSFAPIAAAIREINGGLKTLLSEINTSCGQVAIGAQSVSNESNELAGRAVKQDELIQSLENSIEEITVKAKENEEKAISGRQLSEETTNDIGQNKKEMDRLMDAMKEISKMSEDIIKIVKVIDDISFQTNILALNAAVEAARAGSSGKGFAVVAEEVRNLATKSAEATRQTAELIGETTAAVGRGAQMAELAAKSLDQVVEKTIKVDKYMAEIAWNSREENKSMEEVSGHIEGIAQVAAGNARSAQNSASSSEELNRMSETMLALIGKFRLQ